MTDVAEQLIDEALKLPESERRLLAVLLLDSVGEEPSDEVDRAWVEEAHNRLTAIRAGNENVVPWNEARRRIFAQG